MTIEVCEKFFKKYNSLKKISRLKVSEIEKEISRVNYHKTKARNLKGIAERLLGEFGGKVPTEIGELISLPGVGRKTANVFLVDFYGAAAIGVDTYVGRISRKLGWTKEKDPKKIEKDLEKLFPKKYWNVINYVLVGFGQTIGRSRKREDGVLERIKFIK